MAFVFRHQRLSIYQSIKDFFRGVIQHSVHGRMRSRYYPGTLGGGTAIAGCHEQTRHVLCQNGHTVYCLSLSTLVGVAEDQASDGLNELLHTGHKSILTGRRTHRDLAQDFNLEGTIGHAPGNHLLKILKGRLELGLFAFIHLGHRVFGLGLEFGEFCQKLFYFFACRGFAGNGVVQRAMNEFVQ